MTQRMFGSLAVYLSDKMVLVLSESPGERTYRGQAFSFDVWNGLLIPTSLEHHASLSKQFSGLLPHPVLKKWLYLPIDSENFESEAQVLIELVLARDPRMGVLPRQKKKRV